MFFFSVYFGSFIKCNYICQNIDSDFCHFFPVQFNKFVDLCDGCLWHDDQRIEKLDGSTKIERLLTAADGNDWLCHTIDFIVSIAVHKPCMSFKCLYGKNSNFVSKLTSGDV